MLPLLGAFDVYRGNSTDTMRSSYEHKIALPFERIEPVAITLFLQQHWHHSLTLGILYYATIRLLERTMRDRKPFDLRGALFLWNGALAVFSVCGLVRFSEEPLHNLLSQGFAYTVCHTVNPEGPAAFWALLFLLSKLVELGDTLFIVLRKRRLIFLHYYHHAAVLVYSAHVGAEHTGASTLFIPMNLLAHSLMYCYYALTSLGVKVPRPVAMLGTSVQTAQMLCGVAITAFVFKLKVVDATRCQQSMGNLYLALTLYATFAVLFVKFFWDAYVKKGQNQAKEGKKAQ